MAYTTITAATIGLADGDTSPQRLDGTVRITPRFPSAATTDGFTVSGPVVVSVAGGDMPQTVIPSMAGATGVVEFHLYDRNAGPARMPSTEIPLDPDTTISLNEYLPVGVDPVSGAVFIKGETGPQGPQGERGIQGPGGNKGDTGDTGPKGDTGNTGPKGEVGNTGPIGPQGPQGPQGIPGEDGTDGTGVEIKGDLPSVADLPPSGVEGDAYLIDGDLHVWDVLDSAWVNVGPIKGPQGQTGPQGPEGIQGSEGPVGPEGPRGPAGPDGAVGTDGQSAYEVAVSDGFIGTEVEWLESLVGPEGPQGPEGTAGPKGDPGADGAPAPRADLVGALVSPIVISHRGGRSVYPEHSMEGYIASMEAGFLPEQDIQFLSDGTMVCLHDATVDRTMTGITGNVDALTRADWLQGRIKPVYEGGKDAAPVLFEDVLDQLGGRTVLVPEIKNSATATQVQQVIDAIAVRGLEKSVIVQNYTYENAQQVAAAGLHSFLLLRSTLPERNPMDDGIKLAGPRKDMSASDIATLKSWGMTVMPWTINTRSELSGLDADGWFTDDPWYTSGRVQAEGAPLWKRGRAWPWKQNGEGKPGAPSQVESTDWPKISGGQLYVDCSDSRSHNMAISVAHICGGLIAPPYTIRGRFTFGSRTASVSSNFGFTLHRNDNGLDSQWYDGAVPGQNGFTFALRRDGRLSGWEYVDGASASSLGTFTPDESLRPVAPGGGFRTVEMILTHDGAEMTLHCPQVQGSLTMTPSVSGSMLPSIRVSGAECWIEDMSVDLYHI